MFNYRVRNKDGTLVDIILEDKAKELCVLEMAIESAIDIIAKTVAKCEFKVVRRVDGKLKQVKDENYYRLNLKPNANETGFVFWRKAIHKLFHEEEALIVKMKNGDMFLADSFNKTDDVMNGLFFKDVVIEANDNTYQLQRTFHISECLYLRNNGDKSKRLIASFNEMYGNLLGVAIKSFKRSNALKIKGTFPAQNKIQIDGKVIARNEYFEEVKKQFKSDDFEVILSQAGIDYTLLTKETGKGPEDITNLINNAFAIASFCFDIPQDVFIGKTTEKSNAQNDFITFAIKPCVEIIEDSINTTYVSKQEFLDGEMVVIDTTNIMHRDLLSCAQSLDKLFSQGFTHNEICGLTGMIPVDEEWANERYVTKNYSSQKGGENE